jgi:DNA-binding NarL/FixJ family response regulator
VTIRVLVVDDHPVVRSDLVGMLAVEEDLEIVGEACDGEEAVARATALTPDVVLMDLRMPRLDGVGATARIVAGSPSSRVLVLTTYDADADIGRSLYITEATVKTHPLRAFVKLGVDDRTHAVTVAMERGLPPAPGAN